VPALWRRLKPYALVLLLALPALWPSALAGIPRTNDALTHVYRAVELDQLVRAGVFFPRWAPHLVWDYGYPIFDFFPYEAHYLVEGLHLAGLTLLGAYNLAGALALLASGWFAYRLGREHFGETSGLVAGVAYLYSPYLLYDNYIRGSLPESLALALLPLALLFLRRAVHGDRQAAAWAGLALAAAIFAHHGVLLQAMPIVGLYAGWEMVIGNWQLVIGNWQKVTGKTKLPITNDQLLPTTFQLLVLPFIMALALSAFFWLPALTEARFVQTARGTGNGPMNYANNFLGLDQLLALPRLPVDADLLNPPVVHSLPLAALVLAGLGAARWLWPRTRPRGSSQAGGSLLFFGGAALAGTLLIHPLAKPLWDAVPLLQLTLFPWRLLGPVSLFVALAAGALFSDRGPVGQIRRKTDDEGRMSERFVLRLSPFVLLTVSLVVLIASGLPFATPPRETLPANPGLADLAGFEVPPDFIGTTTVGEYLPAWVQQLPDVSADRQSLIQGQSVTRYDVPGAQVQAGPAQPVGASFTVQAAQALTFVYRTFYFPGWQATLDGQPAPITITAPQGLIAVDVPAGTHRLAFTFGTTLPRVVGDGLSIVGLAALGVWLLWAGRTSPPTPSPKRKERLGQGPHDAEGLLPLPPAGEGGRGDEGELLSPKDRSSAQRPASSNRLADLTPPAPIFPAKGAGIFDAHLPQAAQGQGSGGSSTSKEGGRKPTPPELPNALWLFGLAVLIAAARPLLYDGGLTPLMRHGLASRPPAIAVQPLDLSFQGELHLWGADLPTRAVGADDPLAVTLYWQAEHPLGVDYGFDVQLVDAAGHFWTQRGYARPADWRFAPGTDFWPANQYILDPYVLTLLPGTPPGQYNVAVTVFARYNQQSIGTQTVGVVTVGSPSRAQACSGTLPVAPAAGVSLRQAAIAPTTAAPGDAVTVSLCWTATAAPGADLSGQLRLASANGMIVATQPFTLGGQYPASHWKPGDVLRDQVTLLLPAALASGQYSWSVSVAGGQAVALEQEAVTAPMRQYAAPAVATRLDANLGPITLLGFSGLGPRASPGSDLNLTLQWLDNQTPDQSYHVFVHLQAADGSIVAQSDGVPANWTRPTTGWLPGEFVADGRSLHLPPDLAPGAYTLAAGMYRPDTGERLTTNAFPDGQVPLGKIAIGR